jgi:nucleoside-diphosphate-sugar epimerase
VTKFFYWQIWYVLAKVEAEEMAMEYGEKTGLHVVRLCPSVVFGPLLQHVVPNTTSKLLLYIIKGSHHFLQHFAIL